MSMTNSWLAIFVQHKILLSQNAALQSLHYQLRFLMATQPSVPTGASAAILKPSEAVPESSVSVQGPQFDKQYDLQGFLASYQRIGFQATSLSKAIDIVNNMVRQ
jgi:hypothetical protein